MDDERKVININVKGGKAEKIDERLLAIQMISYQTPILAGLHDFVFPDPPPLKIPSENYKRREEFPLDKTKKRRTGTSNEEHKVKFLFCFDILFDLDII